MPDKVAKLAVGLGIVGHTPESDFEGALATITESVADGPEAVHSGRSGGGKSEAMPDVQDFGAVLEDVRVKGEDEAIWEVDLE